MDAEFRSGCLAWAVGIGAFVLILLGLVWFVNSQEGPPSCYKNYTRTYTWSAAQPALDKMWEDEKLTVGECDSLEGINARAQFAEERVRIMRHYGRKP
jgi:hypothetical protein